MSMKLRKIYETKSGNKIKKNLEECKIFNNLIKNKKQLKKISIF